MNSESNAAKADREYMGRALALASFGAGYVSPNPMVGAVIVSPDGRIIGEGWHRRFGGPHAEVNAVASVAEADRRLFPESTIYVTLDPCSHYGKTPPCAKLLAECGFRRVVVAIADPNPKVSGRGLAMLREAGCEVETGVLAVEAEEQNRRFLTAQRLGRPWIQLKWAESADGFIGRLDPEGNPVPVRLSSHLGATLMHRERSMADAIVVGSATALADRPQLTLRHWPGRNPLRVVADRSGRADLATLFPDGNAVSIGAGGETLEEGMRRLMHDHEVGAVMVEGGARLLEAFIAEGLYDEIRVETSPAELGGGVKAPAFTLGNGLVEEESVVFADGSRIRTYRRTRVKKE